MALAEVISVDDILDENYVPNQTDAAAVAPSTAEPHVDERHGVDGEVASVSISEPVDTTLAVERPDWLRSMDALRITLSQVSENFSKYIPDPKHPSPTEYIREQIDKINYRVKLLTPTQWPLLKDLAVSRFLNSAPEPFEFIIQDFLPQEIVGVVYGTGGSLKSLSMLWLTAIRASGVPMKWMDRFEINPGRCMYFTAEDVAVDIHARLAQIRDILVSEYPDESINEKLRENLWIMDAVQWKSDQQHYLVNAEGAATSKLGAMVDRINEAHASLVIIETLSRISDVDDISNRLAASVIRVAEEIRDQTHATVILVAHINKAARVEKGDSQGQNALRGASALLDNARFGLFFQVLPPEARCGFPRLQITQSKAFRAMRTESFSVQVLFPKFQLEEGSEGGPVDQTDARILEYVATHPGQVRDRILADLKGSRGSVNAHLSALLEEGKLRQDIDGHKRPFFVTLPNSSKSVPEHLEGVVLSEDLFSPH